MKYTVKLVNGDIIENCERNWWLILQEPFAWMYFKYNGYIRKIPRSAILWVDPQREIKLKSVI